MKWSDLAQTIGKVAPTIGSLLGGSVGASVETAQIHFMQWASRQIEFVACDTTQKTRAQYSALTTLHKGSGVWVLFGDREPA